MRLKTMNAQGACCPSATFAETGRPTERFWAAISWVGTVAAPRKAKESRTRELDFCNRRLFMPQRTLLRIPGDDVLAVRAWENIGSARKPVVWADRIWGKEGNRIELFSAGAWDWCCRIQQSFPSEAGRACDWLPSARATVFPLWLYGRIAGHMDASH